MATRTKEQEAKILSAKKSERPSVFPPDGAGAEQISQDFESWIILSSTDIKDAIVSWINTLLEKDVDEDFQDLLKETLEAEATISEVLEMDLSDDTKTFTDWRINSGVKGFENVEEMGWLFQELQSGYAPFKILDDNAHRKQLTEATAARFQYSKDSKADRKTRLKAWISCLRSY